MVSSFNGFVAGAWAGGTMHSHRLLKWPTIPANSDRLLHNTPTTCSPDISALSRIPAISMLRCAGYRSLTTITVLKAGYRGSTAGVIFRVE
jgi:hypothetical protein